VVLCGIRGGEGWFGGWFGGDVIVGKLFAGVLHPFFVGSHCSCLL
jgi:hypothetical protein